VIYQQCVRGCRIGRRAALAVLICRQEFWSCCYWTRLEPGSSQAWHRPAGIGWEARSEFVACVVWQGGEAQHSALWLGREGSRGCRSRRRKAILSTNPVPGRMPATSSPAKTQNFPHSLENNTSASKSPFGKNGGRGDRSALSLFYL